MAGRLADDDMASRGAYQHFWLSLILYCASHTAMYQALWQHSVEFSSWTLWIILCDNLPS